MGVEDARASYTPLMLPLITEEERLRAAFTMVVASPRLDRVDIASIIFTLRVDCGIALKLRRRNLEYLGFSRG